MNYDDRYYYDQCGTCGVVIMGGDDAKVKHHEWHNSQERLREIIVERLDIPRGILNWD